MKMLDGPMCRTPAQQFGRLDLFKAAFSVCLQTNFETQPTKEGQCHQT